MVTEKDQHGDLEQLIGGRVLAWVGAAAVVAGLALLLALGISQGWIGEGMRTLIAAAVSLGLLGAGAWLQERRGQVQAARAAAAAGVCGLFMTATVATAVYGLLPAAPGLGVAFAIGALATALALRWRSPLMAGLGIAGAIFAPVLVGAPATTMTIAFEAVAVASAVGVLLWARWDWLLLSVMALSTPQWLIWLLHSRSMVEVIAVSLVFGGLYAAAALGFELRMPSERLRLAATIVLTLNALTIGVAGWLRLHELGHGDLATMWLALLASCHLAGGIAAARSRRVAQDVALACFSLALVLADAAFALSVHGPARTAGFAVGGILLAAVVRQQRGGQGGALAQLGLGGHIAVSALQALHDVSQAQTSGSTAMAAGGLVAVATGCLVSGRLAEEGHYAWRVALDVLGLMALAGVALETLGGAALTVAWAAQAAALAKIGARRDDELARSAAFVHLAAAGIWALIDQVAPVGLVEGAVDIGAAVLGGGAVVLATAAAGFALRPGDPARRILMLVTPAVALYALSIVVVSLSPAPLDGGAIQQGQLQLSALWSVAGVAGLVAGLRLRDRAVRLGAWGLLTLAVGKVFLYDLAALTSIYRVASFLALGVLLLVGALAYQRMRPQQLTTV
jgi:uncharacterized membrane protein